MMPEKMKPILFSTDMVRAILDGRKTVTRRVVPYELSGAYDDPKGLSDGSYEFAVPVYALGNSDLQYVHVKPKYQPGDILWVRETTYLCGRWVKNGITKTGKQKWRFIWDKSKPVFYAESTPDDIKRLRTDVGYFKRPAIFMPREAARLFLKVTNVRVERLQEITEEDARAEGITEYIIQFKSKFTEAENDTWRNRTTTENFAALWDSINGKRYSWESNPWVWRVEFKGTDRISGE